MNGLLERTLEELEGEVWGEPNFDSHLVTTCHRLRKKPIGQFSIEDLRIMVGQNIGARFLVPRILDVLETDPFAEGDFFPGDLLASLMRLPDDYWREHDDQLRRAQSTASRALGQLQSAAEQDSYPSDKTLIQEIQQFLGKH